MHDLATIIRMNAAVTRGHKMPAPTPPPTPESAAGQALAAGLRVKLEREKADG